MKKNSIQLIRHATLLITVNNIKFLIDPMLSSKGALTPVQNCGNETWFPMVELPFGIEELKKLLNDTDAIVITHLHRDHWDVAAEKLISKDKTIFCQPADLEKIKGQGFKNVNAIDTEIKWKGISINRTKGQHGTGEIGRKMGEVSGFVFAYKDLSIYVAGDTVWCEDVEVALNKFTPTITIANAGAAKFLTGDPITMTANDIQKIHQKDPNTRIIAVHMDTVNHCFLKRTDLLKDLLAMNLDSKVLIPKDGEHINL